MRTTNADVGGRPGIMRAVRTSIVQLLLVLAVVAWVAPAQASHSTEVWFFGEETDCQQTYAYQWKLSPYYGGRRGGYTWVCNNSVITNEYANSTTVHTDGWLEAAANTHYVINHHGSYYGRVRCKSWFSAANPHLMSCSEFR